MFPQCGYSSRIVDVLNTLGIEFGSFNVLTDESIRQGIKEFGNWPTIPQLYVNGKFVADCEIAEKLFESGELQKIIEGTS